MKRFSLDSILLFVLVIPYIMTYGLSPGETPYWLFGLIFLSLLSYLVLDVVRIKEKLYNRLKLSLLGIVILLVLGSSFSAAIVSRHVVAPIYGVHDIILQQEAALRYVLDGKNPYQETYFGTPLEDWHYSDTEVNPALHHYVMQPVYHLFPLPFLYISNRTLGYFDARIPLYVLVFVSLVTASIVVKNPLDKRLFVTLLAFNPAMLGYTLEGRSDMFLYGFMIVSFYLLLKRRFVLGSGGLALAFAVKQSIWPLFPFYVLYLWFQNKSKKVVFSSLLVFTFVFGSAVVPYVLWDAQAYMQSTILYLSGQTEHAYPISGYGLGMLLSQLGFIQDRNAYYPFIIWQALACIPLFVVLFYHFKKHPSLRTMIFAYGIFLFVYWYLSRYFNNSHLGYLSVVFLTAYFWPEEERSEASEEKRS